MKLTTSIFFVYLFCFSGFAQEPEMADQEDVQFATVFINANKERILGNHTEASKLYAQALSLKPDNAAAYFDLGKIYIELKDFGQAEQVLQKSLEFDPNNHWYKEYLARVLNRTGKYKESAGMYDELMKEFPNNPDFALRYANAVMQIGKHKKVLKAFDRIDSDYGLIPELYFRKYEYFISKNQLKEAEVVLLDLIEFDPDNTQFYTSLADLYKAQGKMEEAIAIYTKANDRNPNNPYIQLALYDFYYQKRKINEANNYLFQAFSNAALDIDTKVGMLLKMFPLAEKNPEYLAQAIEMAEMVKSVHPDQAKSYAVAGDLLALKGDNASALDNYLQAIRKDASKYAIWSQILLIEAQLQHFDSLVVHSRTAIELFPTQPASYLFNGIANNQKENYGESAKNLKMGALLTVGNKALSAQMLASLGDAYHELDKPTSSDSAYEASLSYDPNNLYVLNNYAYFLSLRGDRLDKAEEMSMRTVEAEPNNASYLDTYGWILFQREKYNEAEEYLKKALDHGGDSSAEVLEHYGDVLVKLQNVSEAKVYYKRALAKGDASEQIKEKIERLP